MELIFKQQFQVSSAAVDCFGRLKPSMLLYYCQEVAGNHCIELGTDYDSMAAKDMFWAIIRQKVQVNRLPMVGETITVETWPMPTTRTNYPRATVGYDAEGNELSVPGSLSPKDLAGLYSRRVGYTDLDRNGHMNNCRYLDWISDLLPSPFHAQHTLKEFTICYLSEAREGQQLDLHWDFLEDGALRVDAFRRGETKDERVLSAKLLFE